MYLKYIIMQEKFAWNVHKKVTEYGWAKFSQEEITDAIIKDLQGDRSYERPKFVNKEGYADEDQKYRVITY